MGESVENPRLYFENNVQKGIALLGSLLELGVRRFVFSSSCATYGEVEALPVRENSRQCPTSPYGWSKLLLERVLSSYDTAYEMKFVALRHSTPPAQRENTEEDHQPETHLIANILQVASGMRSELSIFGNTYATPDGTAIRDYIHVSDLAEANASALSYLRRAGRRSFST